LRREIGGVSNKFRLDEKDVLDGDIYGMIAPYATANLWVRDP
jgi:hypothetical protein